MLDTAFSVDGSHVVSVGRDMTVKLTEVATQRFIDNVTSITPGVLKGGIQAVARHPQYDQVVVGGSDGTPKVYRIFREAKRVIGDDANLVFELFPMPGRVFSVGFSADGKRVAAGSSLDGTGEVLICSFDYDGDVPADIKAIMGKVPGTRSPEERAKLDAYKDKGVRQLARIALPGAGVYAVAFSPVGKWLAAAGSDGKVRLIDATGGKVAREFAPAPLGGDAPRPTASVATTRAQEEAVETELLPSGVKVTGLEVSPSQVTLTGRFDEMQLLVTGKLDSGETLDVTRMVKAGLSVPLATVSPTGLIRPSADGRGTLRLSLDDQAVEVPVDRHGARDRAPRRLHPRRQPGALAPGLQPGHLPRRGQGEERVQALAPGLRPGLRPPRPDRRPRRAAGQRGLARRQPDAPEAHRRRAARRRPALASRASRITRSSAPGSPTARSSTWGRPGWRGSRSSPPTRSCSGSARSSRCGCWRPPPTDSSAT